MARLHHRVQTIYTIPSHNASLCQDDVVSLVDGGVEAGWLDTEAETHLKQRGFSLQPQRKCVCVVFSLRQDNGPQLPPFVCPDDSGLFCAAGNAVKQQSFQIGTVTMSDFDFDLVLNL